MRARPTSLILLGVFFMFAGLALAQTAVIENSGFVPSNLWFSKAPSIPNETVQIYTLVWNASSNDISGTVSFFDNDTPIGKQSFILAGEGSSKILSVPWLVGEGYHKIYAKITESSGGPREQSVGSVSLRYNKTQEAEQFVAAPSLPPAGTTANNQTASAIANNPVSNYVAEKAAFASGYAEANLPAPVVGSAKTITSVLESARAGAQSWTKTATAQLQKSLQATAVDQKKSKNSTAQNGFVIDGPVKYAALSLLSVGSFALGNTLIFYGGLAIIIFFVLRFIRRKFFF